jgi:cysteinyl-tRNA synthetase
LRYGYSTNYKEMKILNTLTKKKEEFSPIDGKKVKMYTCGVTVYDHCHIGHARSLYVFEVIRRYLEFKGYDVTLVRNITDIDDKIINKARIWAKEQDISLQVAFDKVRNTYIDSYYSDLSALGLPKADFEPKATDSINEMKAYIKKLIDKGLAYERNGSVYFSPRKYNNQRDFFDNKIKLYGALSGNTIEQMLSDVSDFDKDDSLDFALWKQAKIDEPSWSSPWGKGRPGWHIECSVMSQQYLKVETFDIHGGGLDLVFPHHDNELAQAQACTGKPFANYWIHHGLLTINKQKMAKSLGNFVTIVDVLKKYPADVLKLFYLQAHYSSSIDFSWKRMEEAKKAYERIVILRDKIKNNKLSENIKSVKWGTVSGLFLKDQFLEALDDDFNMPRALAVLFDMVNKCYVILDNKDKQADGKIAYALRILSEIAGIFCLTFNKDNLENITEEEIEAKIKLRIDAKNNKDYDQADEIRKELQEKGIILEDTKEGVKWRRRI